MSKGKMIAIGVLVVVAAVLVYLMFSDTATPDETTNPDGLPDGSPEPPYRATVTQVTDYLVGLKTDRMGNVIETFDVYGSDGKVINTYVINADRTGYNIKK